MHEVISKNNTVLGFGQSELEQVGKFCNFEKMYGHENGSHKDEIK